MKLIIDTDTKKLSTTADGESVCMDLYSREAFELISHQWLKVGWNQKYLYTFSWMGRPVIQLPEDLLRVQEVIYRVSPDVIIETGIAHGGSLVFYASLCKAIGHGRVIGVDIDIRPHNRGAIEAHELFPLITLIEGSSIAPEIISKVKSQVSQSETVLVLLDSCHTKAHVLAELEAYHDLVSIGSYIIATDGSMQVLSDVPRGRFEWREDNPAAAAMEFAARHSEFMLEQPAWTFNESDLVESITHCPNWLCRLR